MRRIVLLTLLLGVIGVGVYVLFFKKPASPTAAQLASSVKKPQKPNPPSSSQSSASSDNWSFPSQPSNPSKEKAAEGYWKNSHIQEELYDDAQSLNDYWNDYSYYGTPDEQWEYAQQQQQWEEQMLWEEYQRQMYEMEAEELYQLSSIYSDPDVERFRNAEMSVRREEKKGDKPDQKDWKNLSKDRKDALKKMAENPNDKNELARLNQATKPMSDKQVKHVQEKLADPVVKKAKAVKTKIFQKATEKIKEVVRRPQEEISLFQVKEGDKKKIYIYAKRKESFEEDVPEALRVKALNANVLIEQDAPEDLVALFDSKKRVAIAASDPVQKFEEELEKHKGSKVLIAAREGRLYGGKGVLSLFKKEGYKVYYYNEKNELLEYKPQPRRSEATGSGRKKGR